jgi:hypothetical protein
LEVCRLIAKQRLACDESPKLSTHFTRALAKRLKYMFRNPRLDKELFLRQVQQNMKRKTDTSRITPDRLIFDTFCHSCQIVLKPSISPSPLIVDKKSIKAHLDYEMTSSKELELQSECVTFETEFDYLGFYTSSLELECKH